MSYGKPVAIVQVNNGGFMKQQTLNNLFKIAAVISIALLTSCGTSKSTNSDSNVQLSSVVTVDASKPLASCNKLNNSNFSMNIENVKDSNGQVNPQFVKIKFQFVSSFPYWKQNRLLKYRP